MTVGVVVPAAGAGTRLGGGTPKALRQVGGEPLLAHAVRRLQQCPSVGQVVVAAPAEHLHEVRALLPGATVVAGGAERHDSVRAGLAALDDDVSLVLVHDAARAFVPVAVVEAVVEALRAGAEAVVPVVPVHDTVKRVDAAGRVQETLDRSALVGVQTPQGFDRGLLVRAHRAAEQGPAGLHTDDAGLVEALGVAVQTVPGAEEAFKVTRPLDLLLAEALLAASA